MSQDWIAVLISAILAVGVILVGLYCLLEDKK